jgi:hypothetical protein
VNHPFVNYKRGNGAFLASSGKINKCENMRFLRAILALGFVNKDFVKQTCDEYLESNVNREGESTSSGFLPSYEQLWSGTRWGRVDAPSLFPRGGAPI